MEQFICIALKLSGHWINATILLHSQTLSISGAGLDTWLLHDDRFLSDSSFEINTIIHIISLVLSIIRTVGQPPLFERLPAATAVQYI